MSLELYAAPAVEPISLQEAKDHLRSIVESEGIEDSLIEALISAAREHVDGRDGILGRQLITATWDLTLDEFPACDWIPLPLAPVQSIASITYLDADGVSQTFSASNYALSADKNVSPRVDLAYNASWPGTRNVRDAVTVRFVAGYGNGQASIPYRIRAAMLLLVSHLYNNREAVVVGANAVELPMGVDTLLAPYTRIRFV